MSYRITQISLITKNTLVVLLLLTVCCLLPTAVQAQAGSAGILPAGAVKASDEKKEQAGMPALPPALPAADLLNIRNLQFDQAKRLLEMQNLKSRYEQLNAESQSFQPAMKTIIDAAAKAAGIDQTKWVFDADKLKFVEKQSEPPASAGGQKAEKKEQAGMPALPAKPQ